MGNNNSTTTTSNSSNGKNDEDEPTKKKRELILEEIIQTEKSYVTYLSAIQEVYIDPLRNQNKSLIKEEHIKSIFLTEDLLKFHVEFFTELAICYNSFSWSNDILPPNSLTKTTVTTNQNRLSTVTTTTTTFSSPNSKPQKLKEITSLESTVAITNIFNKNQDNFKMYSNYIIGYDASVTLLARLRKKKDFSNFLEKCRNDSRCNGLDLNSILIMPVQRLPRYVLLLSELIKQTPPNHPNVKLLNKCLKGIKEVTSFINEAKRDDDNQIKTQQLQETIIEKVNIYENGRKYILDGEFLIHSIYPLKEEDSLLKRIKKYRSSIKGGKSSDDLTEQWVFPDEFKVSKETTFYSFNDCLVLLQKAQKSILSLKSTNRVWNIVDVSLSSKIRVIDVLDIFNLSNSILLFMEKSIYFVQLKNIDKEKFIKTLLMTKATSDWKDLDNDNTNNTNNNIVTDDLPSVLTLRPVTESSSGGNKGFFSNLTSSSSTSLSTSSSSTSAFSSSQNHKKSQSTTSSTKNSKVQNKQSPSQSNPPPPRKSTIFASSEKKS
ncbi:hypothetical protein ACTA71_000066 [Dictyostelium dimigraforme]